jgi:nucleotide-binding universal stress UspA family protein
MLNAASIVVGVDFTPCSATALAQALRISKATGAALHVVHIIDTLVAIELEEALSPMAGASCRSPGAWRLRLAAAGCGDWNRGHGVRAQIVRGCAFGP